MARASFESMRLRAKNPHTKKFTIALARLENARLQEIPGFPLMYPTSSFVFLKAPSGFCQFTVSILPEALLTGVCWAVIQVWGALGMSFIQPISAILSRLEPGLAMTYPPCFSNPLLPAAKRGGDPSSTALHTFATSSVSAVFWFKGGEVLQSEAPPCQRKVFVPGRSQLPALPLIAGPAIREASSSLKPGRAPAALPQVFQNTAILASSSASVGSTA